MTPQVVVRSVTWFASDGPAAAAADVLSPFLNYGVLGLLVLLILSGQLATKGQVADLKADRDAWRAAYDKERESKAVTETALTVAQNQAGLSLEASKTLTALFDKLGHLPRDREGSR